MIKNQTLAQIMDECEDFFSELPLRSANSTPIYNPEALEESKIPEQSDLDRFL